KLGRVRGIKEGDTPSFLWLIPNGLSDPERPWLGSWGGRFGGEGRRLTDVADLDLPTSGDPDPRMSSVYRFRPAYQADSAPRMHGSHKPLRRCQSPAGRPHPGPAGADDQGGQQGGPGRWGHDRPGR